MTPTAPIPIQVEQSFASSLEHLGVAVIDSYLLHGPCQRVGLAAADWEAWRAMEAIHDGGWVRLLGISNVTLEQLQRRLCEGRRRSTPLRAESLLRRPGMGPISVREFCARQRNDLPGLLPAHRQPRGDSRSRTGPDRRTARSGRQPDCFPLRPRRRHPFLMTGTTDADHMRADLEVFDFQLAPEEVERNPRV